MPSRCFIERCRSRRAGPCRRRSGERSHTPMPSTSTAGRSGRRCSGPSSCRRVVEHRGSPRGAGVPDARSGGDVGCPPDAGLVEGWIGRALELAGPHSAARAKALIARCYSTTTSPPRLASEAGRIAERLGDPVLRSYGYDVRGLRAFATGDYDEAVEWHRRRLALVAEISDPDHRADIYASAIAPAVALGRLDEARRHTDSHDEVARGLSPHHRLHGVSVDAGARGAPRRLGGGVRTAAPRGGRGGGEHRDALRAEPAVPARLRAGARPPRRRGGGAPPRAGGRGAQVRPATGPCSTRRGFSSPSSARTSPPSRRCSASRRCARRTGSTSARWRRIWTASRPSAQRARVETRRAGPAARRLPGAVRAPRPRPRAGGPEPRRARGGPSSRRPASRWHAAQTRALL